MRKLCFQVLLSAAVWVSLCGIAAAQHGHGGGNGHGNPFAGGSHDNDGDHHGHGNFAGNHDRDHDGDRDVGPSSRPKGWDKGKKTGWGNCNEPPGLAKKEGGCGSHSHHTYAHHTTHGTSHSTTVQGSVHHTWSRGSSPTAHTTTGAPRVGDGSVHYGQQPNTRVSPSVK